MNSDILNFRFLFREPFEERQIYRILNNLITKDFIKYYEYTCPDKNSTNIMSGFLIIYENKEVCDVFCILKLLLKDISKNNVNINNLFNQNNLLLKKWLDDHKLIYHIEINNDIFHIYNNINKIDAIKNAIKDRFIVDFLKTMETELSPLMEFTICNFDVYRKIINVMNLLYNYDDVYDDVNKIKNNLIEIAELKNNLVRQIFEIKQPLIYKQ